MKGGRAQILLRPGTIVGDYRIKDVIGLGGMGVVYKATDVKLPKLRVAIKALTNVDDPDTVARFLRETEVLSRLRSRHVVKILGRGEISPGVPYFVMEFLEGQSLAALLGKERRLSMERTVEIGLQICLGLSACHQRSIIHRDLKPANIFLHDEPEGEVVKLVDFGISVLPFASQITDLNKVPGTLEYMSPEQAFGQPIDVSSDQFSLAVVLYACLAGALPWPRSNDMITRARQLAEWKLTPLTTHRPDAPASLVAVLEKAMARLPKDRFMSVRELALALLPFASVRVQGLLGDQVRAPVRMVELSEPVSISAPLDDTGSTLPEGIRKTDAEKTRAAPPLETISAVLEEEGGKRAPVPHAGGTRLAEAAEEYRAHSSVPPTRLRRGVIVGLSLASVGVGAVLVVRTLSSGAPGAGEENGSVIYDKTDTGTGQPVLAPDAGSPRQLVGVPSDGPDAAGALRKADDSRLVSGQAEESRDAGVDRPAEKRPRKRKTKVEVEYTPDGTPVLR
jgi:serine/threonine protein kinase